MKNRVATKEEIEQAINQVSISYSQLLFAIGRL